MDEKELTDIEARANAATEGPWRVDVTGDCMSAVTGGGWWICEMRGGYRPEADAVFITNARSDVPALAAALREAWERIEALEKRAEAADDWG